LESTSKSQKGAIQVRESLSQSKRTHEFQIAGVPYKLKTSHDEVLVKELVEFLNQRMSQALTVTKNASYQNAAVLTALHLAEELILLKRKASSELETLEEKILKISQDLENSKSAAPRT
jgi:cell division protein ZapA